MIALLLLTTALAEEIPDPTPTEPAMWAGRMAVFGERKLPFMGVVEFRNDNYVLATVVTDPDGSHRVDQRVCRVAFEKVAGAQASMKETAPRAMPVASPHFIPTSDGTFEAGAWPSGWNDSDHDEDGFPGIAVHISSMLCGGTMHMSSDATTLAAAKTHEGGLRGRASIRVAQYVHKVQGACLSLVTKDVVQDLRAQFVYLPVLPGSTCDNVDEASWPDPTTIDLTDIEAPTLPDQPKKK